MQKALADLQQQQMHPLTPAKYVVQAVFQSRAKGSETQAGAHTGDDAAGGRCVAVRRRRRLFTSNVELRGIS